MFKTQAVLLIALCLQLTSCSVISKHKVELSSIGKVEDCGGYDASFGQFPWYAHIEGYTGTNQVKPCGGTIISSRFVLTEAFCGMASTSYHLYFGHTNFSQNSDPVISNIFISHPLFNYPSWLDNNIALIQLHDHIEMSSKVQPISLPWTSVDEISLHTFFVGTRLNDAGVVHGIRWYFLQVITNEECGTADTNILCTDSTEGTYFNVNQTQCALNYGSALAFFVNNKWIQAGISSVPSFCDSTTPGIFTRVSAYINWISAITGITA